MNFPHNRKPSAAAFTPAAEASAETHTAPQEEVTGHFIEMSEQGGQESHPSIETVFEGISTKPLEQRSEGEQPDWNTFVPNYPRNPQWGAEESRDHTYFAYNDQPQLNQMSEFNQPSRWKPGHMFDDRTGLRHRLFGPRPEPVTSQNQFSMQDDFNPHRSSLAVELVAADSPELINLFIRNILENRGRYVQQGYERPYLTVKMVAEYQRMRQHVTEEVAKAFDIDLNMPKEIKIIDGLGTGTLGGKRTHKLWPGLCRMFSVNNAMPSTVTEGLMSAAWLCETFNVVDGVILVPVSAKKPLQSYQELFRKLRVVFAQKPHNQALKVAAGLVNLHNTIMEITGDEPFKFDVHLTDSFSNNMPEGYVGLDDHRVRTLRSAGVHVYDNHINYLRYNEKEKTYLFVFPEDTNAVM